jgi:hypothetical protein
MPSHDITEPGALSGIKDEEEEKRTFTVPLYEYQAQTPDLGGQSLSDVYGSASMPMFRWVKKVQTGEKVIDLEDTGDQEMQKAYEAFVAKNGVPEGLLSPQELLKKSSGEFGAALGQPLGQSIAQAVMTEGVGAGDVFKSIVPFGLAGKGALDIGPSQYIADGKVFDMEPSTDLAKIGGVRGANIFASKAGTSTPGQFYTGDALKASAGGAVGNFAVQLAMGEDPASAARKAGASAIVSHVAKSVLVPFLGPVGGLIGGLVGGAVGGRVICNELMKQGLLSKEDVILDYRFTRDYLTPQHVNGYHLWAVWVVKQMRKGRMVSFWKYIAQSRANEIAYIYGKKDKPDYIGKAIRIIGEPVCWFLGLFCKKTDWSTLYKEKET